MTAAPTIIMGDPDRPSLSHHRRLSELARAAIAEQRAPLVIHPRFLPWLYQAQVRPPSVAPYASRIAEGLVAPMARDTRAQLWLLLDAQDDDRLCPWAREAVRWWLDARRLRNPGRASGILAHVWGTWEPRVRGAGVAREEVAHGAV